MSMCQLKTADGTKIRTTKCGRTVVVGEATGWGSLVTCPDCLAGRPARDDHAESIEAMLTDV